MPIQIVLADDHSVLRAGLRILLDAQSGMEVSGEASTGAEAVALVAELNPDVVILDITMPGMNGLGALGQIRQNSPSTRVLILTMHNEVAYVRQFLQAGARGYVVKSVADTELVEAIRTVCRGELFIDPSLERALVSVLLDVPGDTTSLNASLTGREQEVLRYVVYGYTNKEVGQELHVSVKTVESHRRNVMQKLGIQTRAGLVSYAMDEGFFMTA